MSGCVPPPDQIRTGFMLRVVSITSLPLLLALQSSTSLLLLFFRFQAGTEVGRKTRPEHISEGAAAQQAAEREGQQPGQREVPGHALPPTGRRRALQGNPQNTVLLYAT